MQGQVSSQRKKETTTWIIYNIKTNYTAKKKKKNLVVKLETAQSVVAQAFLFHHVTMSRTSGRLQMHG